jgi:hypothetical protein
MLKRRGRRRKKKFLWRVDEMLDRKSRNETEKAKKGIGHRRPLNN